jgi:hypothetical protein
MLAALSDIRHISPIIRKFAKRGLALIRALHVQRQEDRNAPVLRGPSLG